jgi:hypothetical protein
MAFLQKTWKDRVAEYINRRVLTKEDGTTELVSVERSEGTISQEGDAFSAANMNDLEQRIANEFSEQNKNLVAEDGTPFRFGVNENGEYGYVVTDAEGADTVIPFKIENFHQGSKTQDGSSGLSIVCGFKPRCVHVIYIWNGHMATSTLMIHNDEVVFSKRVSSWGLNEKSGITINNTGFSMTGISPNSVTVYYACLS